MAQAKNSTEVLKAVKWMLENIGWTQNHSYQYDDETGKITAMCISGAIRQVEALPQHRDRAMQRLNALVPAKMGHAVTFNDHEKTTKKMVINLINRALRKGSK